MITIFSIQFLILALLHKRHLALGPSPTKMSKFLTRVILALQREKEPFKASSEKPPLFTFSNTYVNFILEKNNLIENFLTITTPQK